jgi:hypothetical protein
MFINTNFIDDKRQVGDINSDSFIKTILESNEIQEINTIFTDLVYNKEIKADEMPKYFKDFFVEYSSMPDFYDQSKIELAQDCFKRFGPSIIIAYFCKSLPECYACGKGSEVLIQTKRLTNHTRRRIAQTAQFVIDVMSPNGLTNEGRGLATSLKIRLIHSSIRYYFVKSVESNRIQYDIPQNGVPINQIDLLGTMLAFSVVVVQGLEGLGIKLTNEEKEAILHLWKCVGFLIGIETELMPNDYAEAETLWKIITTTQDNFKPTIAGTILNNDLIELLDNLIPLKFLDNIVLLLMNKLIDNRAKEALSLQSNKDKNIFALLSYLFTIGFLNFESEGPVSRFFTNFINLRLMNELKNYVSEGEEVAILIPPGLQKDWDSSNSIFNVFKGKS